MSGGFSVHDNSGGFEGDLSESLRQLAERDNPTPEPSEHEKLQQAAYDAQVAEERELATEAQELMRQAQAGLAKQNKAAADKREQHFADGSNYFYSDGELYVTGPSNEVYKVGSDGSRVRVRGAVRSGPEEFAKAEKEELDRAFANARRRKISSIVRE